MPSGDSQNPRSESYFARDRNLRHRATDGDHEIRLHFLSAQERRERILEIIFCRIDVPLLPGGELVVDPAVIAHPALAVDDERLGCQLGADLPREHSVLVACHGKLQAEIAGVGLDVRVAQIRL